jgi:hypothetical protein
MVAVSLSCQETFLENRPGTQERARQLHDAVSQARTGLVRAWPYTFAGGSNTHMGMHIVWAHLDFACRCVDARRLETAHGRNRHISVRHSSNRDPEVDMMKAYAIRQSIEYWAHGGHKHGTGYFKPGPKLLEMFETHPFMKQLMGGSLEATTYAETDVAGGAEDMPLTDDVTAPRPTRERLDEETQGCLNAASRARRAPGSNATEEKNEPAAGGITPLTTVHKYKRVKVRGRPRWRRRIAVGETWEVDLPLGAQETNLQRERNPPVAEVDEIIGRDEGDGEELWVKLSWYAREGTATDRVTGSPLYKKLDVVGNRKHFRLLAPSALLRPVHVLKLACGDALDCSSINAASVSGHPAPSSQFAIGCPLTEPGNTFCLNPFYVH